MPRADYEALEARRQARRDRGDDSNDSTVVNNDNDQDDPSREDPIEATIRRATTTMFQRVLMFNQGAAESLYDDQMITTIEILRELDDDTIKETCKAIRKPTGGTRGYHISEFSVTRFKLFAFWARHMWRTCRPISDWTETSWDDVSGLKNQKTLEDNLQDRKAPEPPVMILDPQTAAKTLLEMTTSLSKLWGITGIPLFICPKIYPEEPE